MKQIIKGKKYDTDTAAEVGYWTNGDDSSDLHFVLEELHRKRTGEYFLYGEGGALSKYSEQRGQNTWYGSSMIIPLSYEGARSWAEEHLEVDEYEAEFGEVSEGDEETAVVSATVSAAAKRALERAAAKAGETQSAVLERLLLSLGE